MRVGPEHDSIKFDRTDSGLQIQLHGQDLTRILQWLDVRQNTPRIEVNGVTARRLDNRDP